MNIHRRLGHFRRNLGHFAREPWLFLGRNYSHQQCLSKNPGGYCGIGGTGVSCPVGLGVPEATRT